MALYDKTAKYFLNTLFEEILRPRCLNSRADTKFLFSYFCEKKFQNFCENLKKLDFFIRLESTLTSDL
jgi:hypothetical protein